MRRRHSFFVKCLVFFLLALLLTGCTNYFDNTPVNQTEVTRYEMKEDDYVLLEEISENAEPSKSTVTQYEYDQYGQKIAEELKNIDGNVKRRTQYEYNEKGLIVKEEKTDTSGKVTYTASYEYDSWGRLLKKYSNDSTKEYPETTEYKYDKYDNVIYYKNDPPFAGGVSEYNTSYDYLENGVVQSYTKTGREGRHSVRETLQNTYDENGNLIQKKEMHKTAGRDANTHITTYEYYDDGVLKLARTESDNGKVQTTTIKTYDERGVLVTSDSDSYLEIIEYDDKMRVISKRYQAKVDTKEDYSYEYQYDSMGNLISEKYVTMSESAYKKEYEFDENGCCISYRKYDSTGTLVNSFKYTYISWSDYCSRIE